MHSNANSNHYKEIRSIRMQMRTIRKGFEAFESKFKPMERDSKHSNANSNDSKWIQSIQMQILKITICIRMVRIWFEGLEFTFECFESLSNGLNVHLNPFRMVRIWIRKLRISFECFEFAFENFKSLSSGSNLLAMGE